MTGKENIRINKVVKDFNIGMGTLVEFLKKKGFEIDATPNAKISPEAFDLVAKEFGNHYFHLPADKSINFTILSTSVGENHPTRSSRLNHVN